MENITTVLGIVFFVIGIAVILLAIGLWVIIWKMFNLQGRVVRIETWIANVERRAVRGE